MTQILVFGGSITLGAWDMEGCWADFCRLARKFIKIGIRKYVKG